ncbi:Red chlorophyll catabolite reductase-like protein [Drosera capensis]
MHEFAVHDEADEGPDGGSGLHRARIGSQLLLVVSRLMWRGMGMRADPLRQRCSCDLDTQLDKHSQQIEKIPEVSCYVSTALYLRCTVSPTAIFVTIKSEGGGAERLEEIVKDNVNVVAKDLLGIWLDVCVSGPREVEEDERSILKRRDQVFKAKRQKLTWVLACRGCLGKRLQTGHLLIFMPVTKSCDKVSKRGTYGTKAVPHSRSSWRIDEGVYKDASVSPEAMMGPQPTPTCQIVPVNNDSCISGSQQAW